ncbi:MAG: bifunctional hydroxymethylpyrimidine kinase/phosphomethylpyrimidine kinase [Capsulimonadaceae bacterium]|nr:bifunctional hydroxymethylpyrimidine kinase/phosphomethylpyrimidine kinase [Capsulimonadaceae bacterium]
MKRPVVLVIAGHDPSGGAGLTADQRVIEAMGGIAVSVVTALTIQSTAGVRAVHPVDPSVLAAQLDEILADCSPRAVKIGMLGGGRQVAEAARALRRHCPPNIVLDPVLASTGGAPLLDDAGLAALVADLMPLCRVITPNLHEATRLVGFTVTDIESMQRAAAALQALGVREVVVKGGHLDGEPADVAALADGSVVIIRGARVKTGHTHGTGCFLSSAIAYGLAMGLPLDQAARAARTLLVKSLEKPVVIGRGRGYPGVLAGKHE